MGIAKKTPSAIFRVCICATYVYVCNNQTIRSSDVTSKINFIECGAKIYMTSLCQLWTNTKIHLRETAGAHPFAIYRNWLLYQSIAKGQIHGNYSAESTRCVSEPKVNTKLGPGYNAICSGRLDGLLFTNHGINRENSAVCCIPCGADLSSNTLLR